jgi:hypothetical protein
MTREERVVKAAMEWWEYHGHPTYGIGVRGRIYSRLFSYNRPLADACARLAAARRKK